MKKKFFSILFAVVLVASFSLVPAVMVGAKSDIHVPSEYDTIQLAIDAADPGDAIIVAVGAYTEDLTIDEIGLTITSSDGAAVTTITGSQTITADGVTLNGFTLTGGGPLITVSDAASVRSGVTISNNTITGATGAGIRLGVDSGFGVNGVMIVGNTITGSTGKGIQFYNAGDYAAQHISNVTIRGNVISNNGSSGISTYGPGPNTIVDNTVSGNAGNGISIKYDDGDVVRGNTVTNNVDMGINMHQVTNCVVENNTVSGHVNPGVVTTFWGGLTDVGKGSGIYIHELSLGNTIRYNNITGNNNGVLISSEDGGLPSGNSITYNNIVGNNYYGVLSALPGTEPSINAINNWWDAINGPSGAGSGPGDAVSSNVLFAPWLASPYNPSTTEMTATYIPPSIGISVSPISVDFGSVVPGTLSAAQTVTVTNTGTVAEDFSASITNESPAGVYTGTPGLEMDGDSVDAWLSMGVAVDGTEVPSLILTVPSGTAPGTYTATLVFWAEMH